MKLYLIAGEASGDLHGSNLIKALKELYPNCDFRCWGGEKMKAAGATLVKDYKDLAFMGFWEVLKNLPVILNNFSECKKDILAYQPDAVILIDYPGFNMRLLKFLNNHKINTFYYISPQLWAWNASRVHSIKKYVDLMMVILPFEKAFYKKYDTEAHFVGHPLLDIPEIKNAHHIENQNKRIALLPGSRKQEIQKTLPLMCELTEHFPDYTFSLAAISNIESAFYKKIIKDKAIEIKTGDTYSLLKESKAAIVTSGTATLETALLNVPQIVVYKGNPVSFWIGKKLVNVPFISLVNLILEKEVVKELIQDDFTKENLIKHLNQILTKEKRESITNEYDILRKKLGGSGASENAANLILNTLQKKMADK
ncbi:MAG: lipid-A-disaccharide synthase [Chitinophagaceae bacterium]|nr:MAG: lipid-A-disaccharide synthase [Chitinophagaceae bacterium]